MTSMSCLDCRLSLQSLLQLHYNTFADLYVLFLLDRILIRLLNIDFAKSYS